jgi:lipopolysaccharide biosynthesis regulator YciM
VDTEEGDLDQEIGDDPAKVAAHLGLLSKDLTVLAPQQAKEVQDALDLQELTRAMTMLAKAREVEAKALKKIAEVIRRQPSLAALAAAIGPLSVLREVKPELQSASPTSVLQAGKLSTPMRDGDRWKCRHCEFVAKTYETVEGHTRKGHTREPIKEKCSNCGRGGWLHHGSLRTHQLRCKGRGKRVAEEGAATPMKRIKPEPVD